MRLLFVEDDRKIAKVVVRGLREEGYDVEHALDGEQALAMILAEAPLPFGLMIFDVRIPKRDGYSLCAEVRALGIRAPILMLTALDTPADRARGLASGADDYIVKPFDFPVLLARLRALTMRAPVEPEGGRMVIDTLIYDVAAKTATRDGRPLDLGPQEAGLLEHLMHNTGRAVGRGMLQQAVWGVDYDGAADVVDVYMERLRKKVDSHGRPLIQAIRDVGYRIGD